jgi:capsular polysaccharide transport system permease protein
MTDVMMRTEQGNVQVAHQADIGRGDIARRRPKRRPWGLIALFIACVIAPTAATVGYVVTTNSPLYASEVSFAIRSRDGQGAMTGLGSLVGSLGVGLASSNDIFAVRSHLQSPELFESLDAATGMSDSARRKDRDWIVRLPDKPTVEQRFRHFQRMVNVRLSTVEQIVTVRAQAFSPAEARALAQRLVGLSESFVNRLNERAKLDFVAFAEGEVRKAEERVARTRLEITRWRNANLQVDPQKAVESQFAIIAGLEGDLARIRADISQMESMTTDVQARMRQSRLRERA